MDEDSIGKEISGCRSFRYSFFRVSLFHLSLIENNGHNSVLFFEIRFRETLLQTFFYNFYRAVSPCFDQSGKIKNIQPQRGLYMIGENLSQRINHRTKDTKNAKKGVNRNG